MVYFCAPIGAIFTCERVETYLDPGAYVVFGDQARKRTNRGSSDESVYNFKSWTSERVCGVYVVFTEPEDWDSAVDSRARSDTQGFRTACGYSWMVEAIRNGGAPYKFRHLLRTVALWSHALFSGNPFHPSIEWNAVDWFLNYVPNSGSGLISGWIAWSRFPIQRGNASARSVNLPVGKLCGMRSYTVTNRWQ